MPVRLEASFDSARVLTGPRPVIRALVAGRARDLIKLYDTPPVVRRVVTDDAPDSVAVDLRPADVYIPPDVDAIVRDVQPRTLVLVFDVTYVATRAGRERGSRRSSTVGRRVDVDAPNASRAGQRHHHRAAACRQRR